MCYSLSYTDWCLCVLRLEGSLLSVERLLGRLDEREGSDGACGPEVVVVDGPEHDAAQALLGDVVALLPSHVLVVVAYPQAVAVVGVGAHLAGVGELHLPVVVLDAGANLWD